MSEKKQKLPPGIRRLYRPGDKPGKPTGRYQARYPVTRDGVTRQVSAGTFASLVDAKDARSLQIAKLRTGDWVDPVGPRTTFDAWADRWLELAGGNTKTQSFLRARLRPQWGTRRLGEITPMDVQMWMNAMVAEGLAPNTVHGIYSLFKRMMQDAVDRDVLPKTPCRAITGKPVKKTVKKKVPLSVEQIVWLEANAPERYRAVVHLGAWAGLRIGEIIGLRWTDVDLETGLLHIQRTGRSDTTKNGEDRFVSLAPETVEVLRAHRRDFASDTWVFVTPVHRRQLQYADFRRGVWLPLAAGLELDVPPTFHDLRHAHATLMVARGLDYKVLSQRLGHHAPSFTMDVYGSPRADADEVTIAAIQAAMNGE